MLELRKPFKKTMKEVIHGLINRLLEANVNN